MKARDYHVYGEQSYINRLKEEYEFLGRYCSTPEPNHLVVHALPPRKVKEKKNSQSRDGKAVGSGKTGVHSKVSGRDR